MKTIKRKSNSGLSLIEIVIVVSILSIFSVFLVNLTMASQNTMVVQQTAVPVRMQAKQAMETIMKELRAADPSAPGGISIAGSGNSMELTIRVPNQVSSSSGIQSWNKIQFSHDSINKAIYRTLNDATVTTVGRDIEALQFQNMNNSVYKVTVQTSKTVAGGTNAITATLSSQARLRN